jgi:hypothetical protein
MISIRLVVLCILSPTYALITWLKHGVPRAQKTTLLRTWSRSSAILTGLAVVAILVAEHTVSVNRCVTIALGVLAFWRLNEIVFAFFTDAYDRLSSKPQTTTFTPPERLKFVAVSYLELIVCFGFTYIGLQDALATLLNPAVQAFKSSLPGLADALYLSSTIITTLGYGDSDPVAWLAKILAIWEVFSGFILFAVALAVYLGSEKAVSATAPVQTHLAGVSDLAQAEVATSQLSSR